MSFRTIMFNNPCYLQIDKNRLQITQNHEIYHVALDDIVCIVLNNRQISLSATLLSECAEYNIVLITCDKTHIPNGILYSYLPHSRQTLVLHKQLSLSKPFKNRVWQLIIKQKIQNQADVLQRLKMKQMIIDKLLFFADNVTSGDKLNYEAQASKIYFIELFGNDFTRISKNRVGNLEYSDINAMLNYAYAIVRSLICRSLVAYGLLPVLGIFHNNQLNSFNLADDFIEPCRAYIDWFIYDLVLQTNDNALNSQTKIKLVDILNYIVIIDNKKTTMLNAIEVMINSFIIVMNSLDYSQLKLISLPNQITRSNIS